MCDEELLLGSSAEGDSLGGNIELSQREINDLLDDEVGRFPSSSNSVRTIDEAPIVDENLDQINSSEEIIGNKEESPTHTVELDANNLNDVNRETQKRKPSISALAGQTTNSYTLPKITSEPPPKRRKCAAYLRERNIARKLVIKPVSAINGDCHLKLANVMESYVRSVLNIDTRIDIMEKDYELFKAEELKKLKAQVDMLRKENYLINQELQKAQQIIKQFVEPPIPQPLTTVNVLRISNPMHISSKQSSSSSINAVRSTNRILQSSSASVSPLPQRPLLEMPFPATVNSFPTFKELGIGRQYGHNAQFPPPLPGQSYTIYDVTKINREIICIVPEIPNVIMKENAIGAPSKPVFHNPDVLGKVGIKICSTTRDFHENWQIAGKIDIDVFNFQNKTVQLFFQISSFRSRGLAGKIDVTSKSIDWGSSNSHPCSETGKMKFRVKFHKNQQFNASDYFYTFAIVSDFRLNQILTSEVRAVSLDIAIGN